MPEPGYVATPIYAVAAAVTLLSTEERKDKAGILTPGEAFFNTKFQVRLYHDRGFFLRASLVITAKFSF